MHFFNNKKKEIISGKNPICKVGSNTLHKLHKKILKGYILTPCTTSPDTF